MITLHKQPDPHCCIVVPNAHVLPQSMCPELVTTWANNRNYALLEEQNQGVQLQGQTRRNTEVIPG
jgi:hypothetical protein